MLKLLPFVPLTVFKDNIGQDNVTFISRTVYK